MIYFRRDGTFAKRVRAHLPVSSLRHLRSSFSAAMLLVFVALSPATLSPSILPLLFLIRTLVTSQHRFYLGHVSTRLFVFAAHKYKSYIIDSKANVGESAAIGRKPLFMFATNRSRRLPVRAMKAQTHAYLRRDCRYVRVNDL